MSLARPLNPRADALAARAAGDRLLALALFREAGDPWSRNDAAQELLALGEVEEARGTAEALARERPDFAPARRTLGLVLRRAGDHDAALGHFRAAFACDRADLWSAYDAAQELRALGRGEEAEETLRALAGATPLPHALRALGSAARERGDGEGALAALRVAADLLPADPWFALDHAETLIALGRVAEGEAALLQLRERHPRFAGAVRARMRLAARRGDPATRLAEARELAALDPDAGPLDLAEALLDAGDAAEAETLAARHLTRHAPTTRAFRLLMRCARQAGDGERALAHARAALQLAPDDAALRAERAQEALALGRTAEAEAEARAALALDPALGAARRVLAQAMRARGDAAGALALLREGWAGGAGPAQAGFALAADLREAGAFAEAETVYERLAGRPEAEAEALVELGLLARRLHGIGAARARLEAALGRDPAHARAHLCLGDLAREAGRADEAREAYGRALAAKPQFGWAHAGLALLAEAEGDAPGAESAWHAAIAADPAEAHPRIALAQRLAERGAFDEARALLATVPPRSPRAGEAALTLARIRRLEGDAPGALAALVEAARRMPDRPEPFVEAAEEALRQGRPEMAEALLSEAEGHCPGHATVLEARARRALSRDDLAEAAALFAAAETADPGRPWPRIMQARLLAMTGEPDRSLDAFAALARRFADRPELRLAEAETLRQLGRIAEAEGRLDAALAETRRAPQVAVAAALSAVECADLRRAEALLAGVATATRADEARLRFARAQIASARWDFETAIREGEAAVRLQPADGWYRNRLAHAALLALDTGLAARVLAEAAAIEAGANALRGKSANPSQSHYGQLLDEFRLDGEALDALRAALARPADERLAAIATCVRAHPDHTAGAVLHFIEARRQGALPERLGLGDGGVPRAIHQFWTDADIPADVAAYMESWRRHHPGWAHRVWSEAEAKAYLAAHHAPEASDAFARAREPAMKADLFRLALLAREGGVWADADDRCLAPVEPLLARGAGLVAYQEDLGSLGNNWLAARPGHPVLLRALTEGVAAVNRGDGDILWLATGPGLLTRVLARARCAEVAEEARDALVLDRAEFLRFVAIHCLAAYKASERHWSRTAFGGRARPRKA